MMNNKGQVVFFLFMLAIVAVVLTIGISYAVRQSSDDAMTSMNCTNSTISDFTKAGCWVADISPAYFIGGLLALAGVIITAKVLTQ